MIAVIKQLRLNEENLVTTSAELLKVLKVPVTNSSLRQKLQEHPHYPSMLSIKDVLREFGIASMAIRKLDNVLTDFELPFITSIQKEEWASPYFTVVSNIENGQLKYFDPQIDRWANCSIEQFETWSPEVVLLVESGEGAGEKDYQEKASTEKLSYLLKYLGWSAPIILTAVCIGYYFITGGFENSWYGSAYLLSSLAGLYITILLLMYEVDSHNPFLKEVCTAGKKMNCAAVLKGKGASIFGISWGIIGFAYFFGAWLFQLISISHNNYQAVLAWQSVFAAPYILFSIYYQRFVIKQWCLLCLTVQGVLFLQVVFTCIGIYSDSINLMSITATAVFAALPSYLLSFFIAYYGVPLFQGIKHNKQLKKRHQQFKNDPDIFHALLSRQKSIGQEPEHLGLTLGNPNARIKLIKVCNPYCGPCANAHPEIEAILHDHPDVQLRMIFTAADDDEDMKAFPVRHLMAIAEKNNPVLLRNALDDWYNAKVKDYEAFASKYPMNGELAEQGQKLKAMKKWCSEVKITGTPTVFVNGYELPSQYRISDLKNLLVN